MDKIIFIDNGRIVAVGKHEELVSSCEEYKNMVDLQKLDEAVEEKKEETTHA
jgi:ATP-binding cassette subfamily B protein